MDRNLQGRMVIIAGSGCGTGLGIAKKLSEKETLIVVSDANEDSARNGVVEIETMSSEAIYILADVSKCEDAQNLVDATIKEMGSLDTLMNNTGINKDRMLHKMSVDGWNTVIAVNLTGIFNCIRAAVNYMRERKCGRVINIFSASYLNGSIGQVNYVAAKTGVVALAKTCAKENGKESITRNAIVPGFIDAEMTRRVPEKVWDIMVGKISMGRIGASEDTGNMIAFLTSDEASYIAQGVFEAGGGMVL